MNNKQAQPAMQHPAHPGGGGGDFNVKGVGMLVVSLKPWLNEQTFLFNIVLNEHVWSFSHLPQHCI